MNGTYAMSTHPGMLLHPTMHSPCSGSLIGFPVENLCCVLTDGASHAVDSSDLAFKLAALYAFRQVDIELESAAEPNSINYSP